MATTTELDAREALAGRLVDGLTQAMEMFGVYLGVELGLYRALDELGAATEAEVAGHAGVAVRYAREWLEQQAVAGYLACDDPAQPAERRRFRLPEGHAEVLVDADSPYHAAPLAQALAGTAGVLPRLLEAYRTAGASPTPTSAGDPRRHRGRQPADVPPRAGRRPGCRRCPTSTGGSARRRRRGCSTWAAAWGRRRSPGQAYPRARSSGSTWTRRRSPRPARRRPRPAWPTGSRSWSATPPTSPPRPRSTW